MAQIPALNLPDLVERCGDDAGLALEVLQIFAAEAPRTTAQLRAATQARDLMQMRKALHKLAGALGNVGAAATSAAARALDRRAGQGEDVTPEVEALLRDLAALGTELPTAVLQLQREADGGAA